MNQLMSDKDVCRAAPATPGLLPKYIFFNGESDTAALLSSPFIHCFCLGKLSYMWLHLHPGGRRTLYVYSSDQKTFCYSFPGMESLEPIH